MSDDRWENTVIMPQSEVQACISDAGYIVITEHDWPNEDVSIAIRPQDVPALVAALMRLAAEAQQT